MTTRARTYKTEGIVLRHADIGEADRLLTLLTPDRGLVRATARGARRSTSKLGGHLDLLRHVSLSVHAGRTLDTVTQAETIESFPRLRECLDGMSRGLYLAELSERFSAEGASNFAVFRLLLRALGYLEARAGRAEGSRAYADLLLRWFEVRLLHLSGFQPEFRDCVECGAELRPEDHVFSAERGGIVCPRCRAAGGDVLLPAGVAALKLLRHLGRADFPSISGLRMGEQEARQAERILRAHIGYVLDRAVRSATFMDQVRDGSRNAGLTP
ncbi:MAG: DNA repair protein RecO [Gemmatimonadetes bacterium]|nr:DNA repair protein RecO [Gemmatimonadota bacterium]